MTKQSPSTDFEDRNEFEFFTTDITKAFERDREITLAFGQTCVEEDNYPEKPAECAPEVEVENKHNEAQQILAESYQINGDKLMTDINTIHFAVSSPDDIVNSHQRQIEKLAADFTVKHKSLIRSGRAAKADVKVIRTKKRLSRTPKANRPEKAFIPAIASAAGELAVTTIPLLSGGIGIFPALGLAFGVTAINTGFSAANGYFWLKKMRPINSGAAWPAYAAVSAVTITVCVGTNLLLGHLRSEKGDFTAAKEALLTNPVGYSEMTGIAISAIGIALAGLWTIVFYKSADPIIAYGDAQRRLEDTGQEIDQNGADFRSALSAATEHSKTQLSTVRSNSTNGIQAAKLILSKAERLSKQFSKRAVAITGFHQRLIIRVRTTLGELWGDKTPSYFEQAPSLTTPPDAFEADKKLKAEYLDCEEKDKLVQKRSDAAAITIEANHQAQLKQTESNMDAL